MNTTLSFTGTRLITGGRPVVSRRDRCDGPVDSAGDRRDGFGAGCRRSPPWAGLGERRGLPETAGGGEVAERCGVARWQPARPPAASIARAVVVAVRLCVRSAIGQALLRRRPAVLDRPDRVRRTPGTQGPVVPHAGCRRLSL